MVPMTAGIGPAMLFMLRVVREQEWQSALKTGRVNLRSNSCIPEVQQHDFRAIAAQNIVPETVSGARKPGAVELPSQVVQLVGNFNKGCAGSLVVARSTILDVRACFPDGHFVRCMGARGKQQTRQPNKQEEAHFEIF